MEKLARTEKLTAQVGLALAAGMVSVMPVTYGAPVLDHVVAGGANVRADGTTTAITSQTRNNVIDWQDFSVEKGEKIQFDGGAKTNNYLNIVTGDAQSRINGTLEGGKDVYIVNPKGVIFGKEAKVDVGNLYVSTTTQALDTSAYLATGASPLVNTSTAAAADVVNMGEINANKVYVEGDTIKFYDTDKISATGSNVQLYANTAIDLGHNATASTTSTTNGTRVRRAPASGTATRLYQTNTTPTDYTNITADNISSMNGSSGNFWLTDDITLSTAYTSAPVTSFSGLFDGNFYTISNLNVSDRNGNAGLFGTLSGTVQHLGISGATVTGKAAGGIAGIVNSGGTIKQSFVKNSTINTTGRPTSTAGGGGITGVLAGTVSESYVTGTKAQAGIAGYLKGSITNTYTTGGTLSYGVFAIVDTGGSASNSYTTASAIASGTGVYDTVKKLTDTSAYYKVDAKDSRDTKIYNNWSISNEGGDNTIWRIYEGQSLPLLRCFLKANGTVKVGYDYTLGTQTGTKAADSTTLGSDGSLIYAASTLDLSNLTTATDDGITVDTSLIQPASGIKNVYFASDGTTVTSRAAYYTGQDGYDLVGNNVLITPKTVTFDQSNFTLSKVYDGATDATTAFKDAMSGSGGTNASGIYASDAANVTITYSDGFAAAFANKNVGSNKDVTVNGTLTLAGTSSDSTTYKNYKIANNGVLSNVTVNGNITPRTIYLTINHTDGIDKTYDGTATVVGNDYLPTNNIALDSTRVAVADATQTANLNKIITGDDLSLNNTGTDATYVNSDGTTPNVHAGAHKVLYTGVSLAGGDADNYTLKYKDNTNTEQDITDGKVLLEGTINRRLLLSNTFTVRDANGNAIDAVKVYDGTSTYSGDANSSGMRVTPADATVDASGNVTNDTGIIAADKDKITFSPTGNGTFKQDDGTTDAVNVADATKVAYTVTASAAAGSEDLLGDYSIGTSTDDATGLDSATGQLSVTGTGKILRRQIDVTFGQTTGIEREYNGGTDVADSYKTVGAASDEDAYLKYNGTSTTRNYTDTQNQQHTLTANNALTGNDNVSFTVNAVYDHANVDRAGGAVDGAVQHNQNAVNYTLTLAGDADKIANYELLSTAHGLTDEEQTTLALDNIAYGTITPKQVNLSWGKVTKTFDGTTTVAAADISPSLSSDVLAADQSGVSVNTDNGLTGTYASANKGTWTVTYTGAKLEGDKAVNYELAADQTGTGTITARALTNSDLTYNFINTPITKTYNGNADADTSHLQSVTVNGVSANGPTGNTLGFTVTAASYDSQNRGGTDDHAVTYTITLDETNENYTYDGLTYADSAARTLTTDSTAGKIYAKDVTVSLLSDEPLEKTYNGNTAADVDGDSLVHMDGLLGTDGISNHTTAAYSDKNVGDRDVIYTLALTGGDATNYNLQDVNGNTITTLNGAGRINARPVVVSFSAMDKTYDGNNTLNGTPTVTFDNVVDGETLVLNNGFTGSYQSANVSGDGTTWTNNGTTYHNWVNYTGLAISDTNYKLVDNLTDQNAIAATDTVKGLGTISAYHLTDDNINVLFNTDANITKVYDASDSVTYDHDGWAHQSGHATATDYLQDHGRAGQQGLSIGGVAFLNGTDYEFSNAVYNSAGVDATQATYTLKLLGNKADNFDFSAVTAAKYSTDGTNKYVYGTHAGTITKKQVTAALTNTPADSAITKAYDGNRNVYVDGALLNLGTKIALTGLIDSDTTGGLAQLDTSASTAQYASADVAYDSGNNVTSQDVNYTVALGGNNAGNYVIGKYTTTDGTEVFSEDSTLTGSGTITPRELTLQVLDDSLTRTYNGQTAVDRAGLAADQKKINTTNLYLDATAGLQNGETLKLNLAGVTAQYGTDDSTAENFTANGDVHVANGTILKKSILISGLQNALATATDGTANVKNYKINDQAFFAVADGKGHIDKLHITQDDFRTPYFDTITKEYDGSANVDNPTEKFHIALDGTRVGTGVDVDIAYELGSAVYDNGAGKQDAPTDGSTNVTYTITGIQAQEFNNYVMDDGLLNQFVNQEYKTQGAITPRKLYMAVDSTAANPVTKTYDGTAAITNTYLHDDPTTADTRDLMDQVHLYTTDDDGNIVDLSSRVHATDINYGDNAKLTLTTAYDSPNVARANDTAHSVTYRGVNYTFGIGGSGDANNYAFYAYDADTGAITTTALTNNTLTDAQGGWINPQTLTLHVVDNAFNREYNGSAALDSSDFTADKIYLDGLQGTDNLTLDYTQLSGQYGTNGSTTNDNFVANGDVNGNEQAKSVQLTGLQAALDNATSSTGTLGSNYAFNVGNTVTFSVGDNKGRITRHAITSNDQIAATFDAISKTYDNSANVAYDHSADVYVGTERGSKTAYEYLTGLTIDGLALTHSDTANDYTISSATYANEDAGTHDVVYKIKLADNIANNFAFGSAVTKYNAGTLTEQTTGTIDKKTVTATLTDNPADSAITKKYDGTTAVTQDVTQKIALSGLIAGDHVALDTGAINAHYAGKDVVFDADGNVTSQNVYYTAALKDTTTGGTHAGNYTINPDTTSTLTGTGTIEQRVLGFDPDENTRDYNGNYVTRPLSGGSFTNLANGETLTPALAYVSGQYGTGASEATFTPDANVNRISKDEVGHKALLYSGLKNALANSTGETDTVKISNYTIADTAYFDEAKQKGKIMPYAITAAAVHTDWGSISKTYDGTTAVTHGTSVGDVETTNPQNLLTLTFTHPDCGESFKLDYTLNDNGANYAQKDQGTGITVNYAITLVPLDYNTDVYRNYDIADRDLLSLQSWSTDTGVITQKVITPELLSRTGQDKTYDGTNKAAETNISVEGIISADTGVITPKIVAYYDSKNAGDRTVGYKVTLEGNEDKHNYKLAAADGAYLTDNADHTDTQVNFDNAATGTIAKRKVRLKLAGDATGIDKEYDGNADVKGTDISKYVVIDDTDADTAAILQKDGVTLDTANIKGTYDGATVNRNSKNEITTRTVTFTNFNFTGDETARANYIFDDTTKLTGTGTINPRQLYVSLKYAPTKTYDNSTAIEGEYATMNNVAVDNTRLVGNDTIDSLGVTLASDTTPYYDTKHAGEKLGVNYKLAWENGNYQLVHVPVNDNDKLDNTAQTLLLHEDIGGIAGRVLTPEVLHDASKVYDGTIAVTDAANNLHINNYVDDGDVNSIVKVVATYSSADAADDETSATTDRTVTYNLSIYNTDDYVFANGKTAQVIGQGTISRKGLTIVANPVKRVQNAALPTSYTGEVNGLVSGGTGSASDFTFATDPAAGVTSTVPGKYGIYGWYQNRTSGNYGTNYTFTQDDSNSTALEIFNMKEYHDRKVPLDNVLPQNAGMAQTNSTNFGEFYREPNAAVAYQNGGKTFTLNGGGTYTDVNSSQQDSKASVMNGTGSYSTAAQLGGSQVIGSIAVQDVGVINMEGSGILDLRQGSVEVATSSQGTVRGIARDNDEEQKNYSDSSEAKAQTASSGNHQETQGSASVETVGSGVNVAG